MKIETFESPFPYIRIYNFYSNEELNLIWKELDFILNDYNLLDSNQTQSATNHSGIQLKNNLGFFLDDLYRNRNTSNILRLNGKIFKVIQEIFDKSNHWFLKNFKVNYYSTLISYYEDNGYYDKHIDNSFATCLTWIYKEPKSFEGGNLLFEDYNIEIEVKNNSLIFFPSIIPHSVSKVSMNKEYFGKNMGRICLSQFMSMSS